MFPHDTYSGTNGLLMPFVDVECNRGSTIVLSSHAKKTDSDITELSYSTVIVVFLSYRIVYPSKTVFDIS